MDPSSGKGLRAGQKRVFFVFFFLWARDFGPTGAGSDFLEKGVFDQTGGPFAVTESISGAQKGVEILKGGPYGISTKKKWAAGPYSVYNVKRSWRTLARPAAAYTEYGYADSQWGCKGQHWREETQNAFSKCKNTGV